MINTPYQNLAQAIIVKAADDYRSALRGDGYGNYSASQVKAECERFFRSAWFEVLTKIDGEVLIEKLQQEVHSK